MVRSERDLLDLLPAYSEGRLADEQAAEVQALLTSYIDGLLNPEIAAAIDQAAKTNPDLAEEIDKAKSGKDILAKIFPSSDEPLEDPDSPEIQQLLDDVFAQHAKTTEPDQQNVVTLPQQKQSHHRPWYALAASIAIVLVGSGIWFTGKLQGRLDQALDAQATLQLQIDELEAAQEKRLGQITGLDERVVHLSADLERAVVARDVARANVEKVEAELITLSTNLRQSEEAYTKATADLSTAESAMATLRDQQQALEQQVAELEVDLQLSDADRQVIEAERAAFATDAEQLRTSLASAVEARDVAKTALAEAEENWTAELAAARERLGTVEREFALAQTNWSDAQRQIVLQAITRAELDNTIANLRAQQTWTFQVAQYHQHFARQPKRRWVDAAANEPQRLQTLLADLGVELGLDQPLPLPQGLSEAGLSFMGARQLVINGITVAQLVYADGQNELFAVCITPNRTGEKRGINRQQFDNDLFMVDWADQDFQYLVVGYEPSQFVQSLSEWLQQDYSL